MKRHQHSTRSTARTTPCPSLYWLVGFAPVAGIPKTERERHHHWRARNDKQAGRQTNDRDRRSRRRGGRRRRRGKEQARAFGDPADGRSRTNERACCSLASSGRTWNEAPSQSSRDFAAASPGLARKRFARAGQSTASQQVS